MKKPILPDINRVEKSSYLSTIDRVGMSNIEIPIRIKELDNNFINSNCDIFVNLIKKDAKGIHMSRLYSKVQDFFNNNIFDEESIKGLLQEIIKTHIEISNSAYIKLGFKYPINKKSLLSDNYGWAFYPVEIYAYVENNNFNIEYKLKIYYSSTCPCSASLARQLIRNNFVNQYPDQNSFTKEEICDWLEKKESIHATAHAQRSFVDIKLKNIENHNFVIKDFIFEIEDLLETAVQTHVKREDEQHFALLNGNNLMFCEDAVRKVQDKLMTIKHIDDFHIFVNHMESLHRHDASAYSSKYGKDNFNL